MSYVIRNMDSQQELRSCAEMQREVWSFETPDIVSADMLEKIRQGGGILLGAFEDDEVSSVLFSVFRLFLQDVRYSTPIC